MNWLQPVLYSALNDFLPPCIQDGLMEELLTEYPLYGGVNK